MNHKSEPDDEVPILTREQIEECLRRGAESARELHRKLRYSNFLPQSSWDLRLD